MKKSNEYEVLTTIIQKALSTLDNVAIEHDKKIKDKDGIKRQIDVLIEYEIAPHIGTQRIIVECKNHGRKVDIAKVGTFIDLVESVNASRGIYVSSAGFQAGAITKANGTNGKVLLHSLSEVNEKDVVEWIRTPSYCFFYEIIENSFQFNLKTKERIDFDSKEELLMAEITQNGTRRTLGAFINQALSVYKHEIKKVLLKNAIALKDKEVLEEIGSLTYTIDLEKTDGFILNKGKEIRTIYIELVFGAKLVKKRNMNNQPLEYSSLSSESKIAEIEKVDFGDYLICSIKNSQSGTLRFFKVSKKGSPKILELYELDGDFCKLSVSQ